MSWKSPLEPIYPYFAIVVPFQYSLGNQKKNYHLGGRCAVENDHSPESSEQEFA